MLCVSVASTGYEKIQGNTIISEQVATHLSPMIGVECVVEVIYISQDYWPSYFCRQCFSWNSKDEIFSHLESTEHRMKYLVRWMLDLLATFSTVVKLRVYNPLAYTNIEEGCTRIQFRKL